MPRVVFLGTPDFAASILQTIHGAGWDIPLVVTQPDRPQGRSRQVAPSAVAETAVRLGLALERPERVGNIADTIWGYEPDCLVVAAYGQLLPAPVFAPSNGRAAINVHASLLPKYRGASPISQAILDGESETGVTLMRIEAGLDTGPTIAARNLPIRPDETAGELSARLAELGGSLLLDSLPGYLAGQLPEVPQDDAAASLTKPLTKDDGAIDWTKDAAYLARHVRAMTPWPGAWTTAEGSRVTITRAAPADGSAEPGTFAAEAPLRVGTGNGLLEITRLKPAGRNELAAEAWLRGYRGTPTFRS